MMYLRDDISLKEATIEDYDTIITFLLNNDYNELDLLNIDLKSQYESNITKFIEEKDKFLYLFEKEKNILGIILFRHLSFDTELFGIKTAKMDNITILKTLSEEDKNSLINYIIDFFLDFMEKEKVKFIQCKIDSRKKLVSDILKEKEFDLITEEVTLLAELKDFKKITHNYEVTLCNEKDVSKLYEITKKGLYKTTRFHLDSNIPAEKANEMQAIWIKNCYKQKLTDSIVLVKNGKDICAYVSCKIYNNVFTQSGKKIGRIVLIAVDKPFQGKGIGSVVINGSFEWFKNNGCEIVLVGTQQINKPAIRAYEKNGFKPFGYSFAFHKWL